MQGREQQSPAITHAAPWGLHAPLPQKPSLAHCPPQQSLPALHAVPSGLQSLPPQRPAMQPALPQHGAPAEHAIPTGVHWVPPQKPPEQSKAQQSVVSVQASPSGLQSWPGAHTPLPLQERPEQQSAEEQLSPTVPQAVRPPPYPSMGVREPHAGAKRVPRTTRRKTSETREASGERMLEA